MITSFTVHDIPRPRPAPLARVLHGGKLARMYTPRKAKIRAWTKAVVVAWKRRSRRQYHGAVRLNIEFHLPRPQAMNRAKDPDGPLIHTARPDLDNLVKAVLDALNGLAWKDDAQVSRLTCSKRYHAKGGAPHAKITIEPDTTGDGGATMLPLRHPEDATWCCAICITVLEGVKKLCITCEQCLSEADPDSLPPDVPMNELKRRVCGTCRKDYLYFPRQTWLGAETTCYECAKCRPNDPDDDPGKGVDQ